MISREQSFAAYPNAFLHYALHHMFACFTTLVINFIEPFKLVGEGKYNLNALRETEVTESFLGLDMEDRGCQNDEPVHNCTTRQYMNTLLNKCKCLPLNLRTNINVNINLHSLIMVKYKLLGIRLQS